MKLQRILLRSQNLLKPQKKVDDPLKNIVGDAIKKKLANKEVMKLGDLDKFFGASEKDDEPKEGTDAYYIKHGLPYKQLDPYD